MYSVAKSFRFFPERGRVGWGWGGSPCTRYLPILREALPTNIEYLSPRPPHLDLLACGTEESEKQSISVAGIGRRGPKPLTIRAL